MSKSRREFLRSSATAAAAFTIAPGARLAALEDPKIKAFEDRMLRARPLALERVRVTGGPLQHAQAITAKYLLSLDPDRMMSFYRVRAGLKPKAEGYPGWDGGGRNLTGHIAGHHLSAVSLMYAATGDARPASTTTYHSYAHCCSLISMRQSRRLASSQSKPLASRSARTWGASRPCSRAAMRLEKLAE